jgi:hypothetical protein
MNKPLKTLVLLGRWDQRQHNGYYSNGRFYYGAAVACTRSAP